MGPIIVFVGPSLPMALAKACLPEADFRAPARQGDIYRVLPSAPSAVVLIDGVFHGAPSVWPREILAALDDGVPVFGSSSMGALRAVECQSFGMIGHGTVFEWFRDGRVEGDDEVALRHADGDNGWRPLSEPLVNIRATLDEAGTAGLVTAEEAQALAADAKRTYYPDRSLHALTDGVVMRQWPVSRRRDVGQWLQDHRVDVKRADAASLLQRIAQDPPLPARPAPLSSHDPFRAAFVSLADADSPGLRDGLVAALHRAPELRAEVLRVERRRWYALEVAGRRGLSLSDAEIDDAEVAHARAHPGFNRGGGHRAAGFSPWEYRKAVAERALADRLLAAEGEAVVLLEWGVAAGIAPSSGGQDLPTRLLTEGPGRFNRTHDEDDCMLRSLRLDGRVDELRKTLL